MTKYQMRMIRKTGEENSGEEASMHGYEVALSVSAARVLKT